jgi:hypothetical protein
MLFHNSSASLYCSDNDNDAIASDDYDDNTA